MKERCDREMAAALLLVLFRGKREVGNSNPKQLNSQQRESHRRLGNVHGARRPGSELPASEKCTVAVLAGCIMPPNLFGHTMSGLHIRQAAVAGVASSQDPFREL